MLGSEDGSQGRQVAEAVEHLRATLSALPDWALYDQQYLETELIPSLGLNDEQLHEQPKELSEYFGTGLHLWQYPNQFSHYMVWLAHNARDVTSYVEIGCRWGGTFALVNEWLLRCGAPLAYSLAVDLIPLPPVLKEYMRQARHVVQYTDRPSTDPATMRRIREMRPDMVFIDGDHSLQGVMHDHLMVRDLAKIIVHHDIESDACFDTGFFWNYARGSEEQFSAYEFCDQYESVNGSFLGIGALLRR